MSAQLSPGDLIVWWEGNRLSPALLLGIEGERARLFTPRGKERRVPLSRLAWSVQGQPFPAGPPGLEAMELLRQASERFEQLAQDVDPALLWDLAVESGQEGYTAAELADLVWGEVDGAHRAALAHALVNDGVRFARKELLWLARDAESMRSLLHQRALAVQRQAEDAQFQEALRAVSTGAPFQLSGSETESRAIDALEALAVFEDALAAPQRDHAMTWVRASGIDYDRPHEGAFRLLRGLGHFSSNDEDLFTPRYRLRGEFPRAVIEAAQSAASQTPAGPRTDLTDLIAVSIDDPETTEIDDLISIESNADCGMRLRVHIADPAAFIEPNSAVDDAARESAVTHYLPGQRLTMFPDAIGEQAASLSPGERRPALSFAIEIDAQGQLQCGEICRSWVCSDRKMTYEQVDQAIAGEPCEGLPPEWFQALARFGQLRAAARDRAGAVRLLADDLEVKVDAMGQPKVRLLASSSAARAAVGEAMIATGASAAQYCQRHALAVVYRRQAAPERWEPIPPGGIRDAVAIRAVRRRLKRAEARLQPGPHFALGLEVYAQATSPLRRYQDLVVQRQIVAHLEGREPPYDVEALQRVLATTDPAEANARRAERDANDYWLLRWYEQRQGETVEALVVDLHPRPTVRLLATGREQRFSSLSGVTLGQELTLRIERVNPRAGLLALQRV